MSRDQRIHAPDLLAGLVQVAIYVESFARGIAVEWDNAQAAQ